MHPQQPTDHSRNTDPPLESPVAQRAIFREEALERYARAQQQVVLPLLISPRFFPYLWILAVLLMVAGLVVGFWPLLDRLVTVP